MFLYLFDKYASPWGLVYPSVEAFFETICLVCHVPFCTLKLPDEWAFLYSLDYRAALGVYLTHHAASYEGSPHNFRGVPLHFFVDPLCLPTYLYAVDVMPAEQQYVQEFPEKNCCVSSAF